MLLAAPYTGQELYLVQRDPTGKSKKGLRLIVGLQLQPGIPDKPYLVQAFNPLRR